MTGIPTRPDRIDLENATVHDQPRPPLTVHDRAASSPSTASDQAALPRLTVDEDEQWAPLAYVGMFVIGFFAPMILHATRKSRFCRFHAVQAANLWIATFTCGLAAAILVYLTGFSAVLVFCAVMTAATVAVFKAAIATNRGEWYRLPPFVAWPLIK